MESIRVVKTLIVTNDDGFTFDVEIDDNVFGLYHKDIAFSGSVVDIGENYITVKQNDGERYITLTFNEIKQLERII